MAHMTQVAVPLLGIVALGGACGGSGESRGDDETKTTAAAAAAPVVRRVSNAMIGKRIGSNNRMTDTTFQFAPMDTVYLSVATEGTSGPGTLTAAWRSQTGEVVQQSTEPVKAAGENTAFQLSQPKGFKPGTYKVILFLGGDSVDTKVFVVKK
jgi:hypothetical protein